MSTPELPILRMGPKSSAASTMSRMVEGCSRSIAALLNVLMLVAGLVLIGLTLWIRFDVNFESEIRQNLLANDGTEAMMVHKQDIRTAITVAFWVLIGFGIAAVVIGLAGVASATFGWRCLLFVTFTFLLLMTLLEIAIGAVVIAKRNEIKGTVQGYVQESFYAAQRNIEPLNYETFKMRYQCCGINGVTSQDCTFGQPTCSESVWDRLDFTLMVAGWVLLGIVILQFISCASLMMAMIWNRRQG